MEAIRFGRVWYSPKNNSRLEVNYDIFKPGQLALTPGAVQLAARLAEGWSEAQPAEVSDIISAEQQQTAVDERKKFLDKVEAEIQSANAQPEAVKFLKAVQLFLLSEWMDAEGKWVLPTHVGLTANRRATLFPFAAAMKRNGMQAVDLGIEIPQGSFNPDIVCVVHHIPVDADNIDEIEKIQTLENERSSFQKPFTMSERLRLAKRMWDRGLNQSSIRHRFGATNGVIVVKLIELNTKFPTLGIYDACFLPPKVSGPEGKMENNPAAINADRLQHTVLQDLVKRCDPTTVIQFNRTEKGKKTPMKLTSRDEVRKYLWERETANSGRALKIMDKGKIEASIKGNDIFVVQIVGDAIIANSLTTIEHFLRPRKFLLDAVVTASTENYLKLEELIKGSGLLNPADLERFEDAKRTLAMAEAEKALAKADDAEGENDDALLRLEHKENVSNENVTPTVPTESVPTVAETVPTVAETVPTVAETVTPTVAETVVTEPVPPEPTVAETVPTADGSKKNRKAKS